MFVSVRAGKAEKDVLRVRSHKKGEGQHASRARCVCEGWARDKHVQARRTMIL